MMRPSSRRLVICLFASIVLCSAKVINTDVSSNYWTKVTTGVVQSVNWLWEFFIVSKSVSRPPRQVKLALVGMGRTGSTSLSAALKKLGYAPIHDDEATEVSDIYAAMMDGSMSMDEVSVQLGKRGFDAPMLNLPKYVDWAATAPDMKVLLSVRDKSRWAQSWLSVAPVAFLPYQRPFSWVKSMQELAALNHELMVNVPTNNHPELYEDIPTLEAGFEAWTDFVIKTVPPDRLLVFDVKQGWEPLCKFLGEPVPEGPFPHINDRAVVDVIVKVLVAITWIWPLLLLLPPLALWLVVKVFYKRKKIQTKKDD